MELNNDVTELAAQQSHVFHARSRTLSVQAIKTRLFAIQTERMLSAVKSMLTAESCAVLSEFFSDHLFMPADRVARDRAVEALYDRMKSIHVMGFSQNLQESVELTRLANALDESLVSILRRRNYTSADQIDAAEIDSAIREENRPQDRERMVELLGNNMRFFHKMSHAPLARFMLPSMKKVARATGVGCLVDQIDIGYQAARSIPNIDAFVSAIYTQECEHLAALFTVN
ncbi:MAG TPA: hypothetical protein VK524_11630 [Polyangiaceae bacterium]|nr:hypothetical protein [Polyangiaceae bacterium]